MGMVWTALAMQFPFLRKGNAKVIAIRRDRRVSEFWYNVRNNPKYNWDRDNERLSQTELGPVMFLGEKNGIPYYFLVENRAKAIDVLGENKGTKEEQDWAAAMSQTWDMAIATERQLTRDDPKKKNDFGMVKTIILVIAVLAGIALLYFLWSNGGIVSIANGISSTVTQKSGSAVVGG